MQRSTDRIYTPSEFVELLQAVLYGADEFNTGIIRSTRTYRDDDTLLVRIPNGQQFTVTVTTVIDAPVVMPAPPKPPRKRTPRKRSPRKAAA